MTTRASPLRIGGVTISPDEGVFPPHYSARRRDLCCHPLFGRCEHLLDVGTGSGILALLWHRLYAGSDGQLKRIDAVDIDEKAVKCAKRNFEKNGLPVDRPDAATGLEIRVFESDVFSALKDDDQYDGIVFNGPHCNATAACTDERRNSLGGALTGILDTGYRATQDFISGLSERLQPNGFALLTYSDYSVPTQFSKFWRSRGNVPKASAANSHGLVDLFSLLREAGLSATLASVHEFEDRLTITDDDLKKLGIRLRKKWLWFNILIRCPEDRNQRDNQRDVTYGFLRSADEIAQVYATASPSSAMHEELLDRFRILLACLCSQMGRFLEELSDHMLCGFSLPGWSNGHRRGTEYTLGWLYGETLFGDPDRTRDYELASGALIESMQPGRGALADECLLAVNVLGEGGVLSDVTATVPDAVTSSNVRLLPSLEEGHRRLEAELPNTGIMPLISKTKEERDDLFGDMDAQIDGFTDHAPLCCKRVGSTVEWILGSKELSDAELAMLQGQSKRLLRGFWINCLDEGLDLGGSPLKYCHFERTLAREGALSASFYVLSSELPQKTFGIEEHLHAFAQMANSSVVSVRLNAERMKQARRAAAAAILARNMSHNIGSHVTPRTKLGDLKQRVRDLLLQDDWWDGGDWNHKAFPIIEELKDKLDYYIQRKAEFIAEFSTDPLISTRGAWFYREIILPLITNTALMDTLAANEGFTYKDFQSPRLAIRCYRKTKNGDEKLRPQFRSDWLPEDALTWPKAMDGAPYAMRHGDFASQALYADTLNLSGKQDACAELADVRVALPGPVGDMAVYSILENVIRNAAKHGSKDRGRPDDRKILVNILIDEGLDTDDVCTITVWDTLSDPSEEIGDEALHKVMQRFVEMDIIEPTGELRQEAWGTAEMVLCANLLQGHPPGEIPEKQLLDVLDEENSKVDENGDKCLTYRFKIPKARTAVFFGWDSDDISSDQQATLASAGYLVRPLAELIEHTDKSLPACDFAVIDAKALAPAKMMEIHGVRHRVPFRIILVGKAGFADTAAKEWMKADDTLNAEERTLDIEWINRVARVDGHPPFDAPGELAPWLWEIWLRHLRQSVPDSEHLGLDVYLQQKKGDRPTKEWIAHADNYNGNVDDKGLSACAVPLRVWGHDKGNSIECLTKARDVRWGERRVVVDRHGNLVQEAGVGSKPEDRTIVIDKVSTDFDLLFNPSFVKPWTTPYELAEAGLLCILVIDERIVQGALKPFDEMGSKKDGFRRAFTGRSDVQPTVWHVARRAGVHVATHIEVNPPPKDGKNVFDIASRDWAETSPSSGGPRTEVKITDSARDFTVDFFNHGGGAIKIDMVIVHQGVADCLNDSQAKLGDRFLAALSDRYWLIVESGRGIPPQVEGSNHKFLTFSAIERAFLRGRVAKLALARMTMSATRHKHKGTRS